MKNSVNKTTILRLAKYLRVLKKLKSLGFNKVFSNNLGDALALTPAVVRKDFSLIGLSGNKRGGYDIDVLIEELSQVLGKDENHKVIVIGCGRIGNALLNYKEFLRDDIQIVAGFDADPAKIDENASIPIYHIDKMQEYAHENNIKVAVLSVPEAAATGAFEQALHAGINGILNFTTVELKCTNQNCRGGDCNAPCNIQNVNIGLEIENLFYLVHMQDHGFNEGDA